MTTGNCSHANALKQNRLIVFLFFFLISKRQQYKKSNIKYEIIFVQTYIIGVKKKNNIFKMKTRA